MRTQEAAFGSEYSRMLPSPVETGEAAADGAKSFDEQSHLTVSVFVVVCLTGCERWTWEVAEPC